MASRWWRRSWTHGHHTDAVFTVRTYAARTTASSGRSSAHLHRRREEVVGQGTAYAQAQRTWAKSSRAALVFVTRLSGTTAAIRGDTVAMGNLSHGLIGPVWLELARAVEQLPEPHGMPGGIPL